MKTRFLIPAAAVAILFGFFWYGLKGDYDPQLIESPLIDKPAPDITAPALANPNQSISLKSFRGQPVVVNFWGTWCVECRTEHPQLLAIQKATSVPILGIAWKDDHVAASQWLAELGNPYHTVVTDDDGRIAIDWGVYGAPETFLVSAGGKVIHKHVGPMSLDIWQREFLAKLKAEAGS